MKPLLKGGNERVAPGFDLVFHGKDILPLAPLFGFGFADVGAGVFARLFAGEDAVLIHD